MAHDVNTAMGLGRTLVNEPKSFPAEVLALAKRGFRELWNARGGGLYACGFVVTFVWLEITSFVGQVVSANDVASFVTSEILEFVFRFSVQSLQNTIFAAIWPVNLLRAFGGYGIVVLAALYFVFPRFIKPHLTRWLHEDDPPQAEAAAEPAPATEKETSPEG